MTGVRLVCGGRHTGETRQHSSLEAAVLMRDTLDADGGLSCSPHTIEILVDDEWREVEP